MNTYEAWLKMGHVDPSERLAEHNCKNCKLRYEVFTARLISCSDYQEEVEIEAKKRQDELQERSYRGWPHYGH